MAGRAARLAAAARALNAKGGARAASAPFSLAFATDRTRGPEPTLVARALPAGAALILRDYDDFRRGETATKLAHICAERGILFLAGGDALLARKAGADGLHLRADQLHAARPRRGDLILSASCHSAEELERAAAIGAGIALLGPVYPTESHPGAPALGAAAFKALAASAALPVLAIGGVDETNAAALAGPNVAGFAAIGAFAPQGRK